MKDIHIFEGKSYISARRASEISDYSPDYIGQLCRANKLDCRMIGRSWFITEESLEQHKAAVLLDEVARNRIENFRSKKIIATKKDASISIASKNNSKISQKPLASRTFVTGKIVSDTKSEEKIISTETASGTSTNISNKILLIPAVTLSESTVARSSTSTSKAFATIPNLESTIVKSNISYLELTRSIILRRAITSILAIILFFGLGTLAIGVFGNSEGIAKTPATVEANIFLAFNSAFSYVRGGYNDVVAFLTRPATISMDSSGSSPPFESGGGGSNASEPPGANMSGIAITSSTGSEIADDAVKEKIKSSFSDDVEIKPDKSGFAGVITPVFRETIGKDFIYVMVPVKDKGTNATP